MPHTAHLDTFARDNLPPRSQWPQLIFGRPELQYPERLNCAAELLDRMVAAGHGERPALWAPVDGRPVHCTYRQLLARANRIARALVEDLGLVPGNRVLLRGPNNPMMAACWLGIVKAGGIVVATMPLLRAKELTQIAVKARCSLALCDGRCWRKWNWRGRTAPICGASSPSMTAAPARSSPCCEGKPDSFDNVDTAADDVALIAFTSGTTGQPKGTLHFHRDVLAMCDCFPRSVLKPGPDDIFCGTPPLAFTFGLGGMLLLPAALGASTVLVEKADAGRRCCRRSRDFKATVCFTAPTFYRAMAPQLAAKDDLGEPAKCVSAGEALPDATRQLWKQATGIEIIDGIGATEMIHIFISRRRSRKAAAAPPARWCRATRRLHRRRRRQPAAAGHGRPARREGPDRLPLPRRRAPAQYVQHGWNLTGDAYSMDADGYFYLPGAHRRHDHLGRLQHRRPGGRGRAAAAPGGGRMRRGRRAGRGARPDRQGLVVLRPATPGDALARRCRTSSSDHRALQVPARRRVRRRAAAHRDRQAAALPAAPATSPSTASASPSSSSNATSPRPPRSARSSPRPALRDARPQLAGDRRRLPLPG
jgi:2-aminobenzoate-CoA ligase